MIIMQCYSPWVSKDQSVYYTFQNYIVRAWSGIQVVDEYDHWIIMMELISTDGGLGIEKKRCCVGYEAGSCSVDKLVLQAAICLYVSKDTGQLSCLLAAVCIHTHVFEQLLHETRPCIQSQLIPRSHPIITYLAEQNTYFMPNGSGWILVSK